jgi:hypothetical protein
MGWVLSRNKKKEHKISATLYGKLFFCYYALLKNLPPF